MTVFRQVFQTALVVVIGFCFGVHAAHREAQTIITDSAGNVLTPSQFSTLMQMQAKADAEQKAIYAATVGQQELEYERRLNRYFAMLAAKARFDYRIGVIRGNDSGVLLQRHIHTMPREI